MLHYFYQLLTICVCLLFGTEQTQLYILNAYLQHVTLITPFYKCFFFFCESNLYYYIRFWWRYFKITHRNKQGNLWSAVERSTLTWSTCIWPGWLRTNIGTSFPLSMIRTNWPTMIRAQLNRPSRDKRTRGCEILILYTFNDKGWHTLVNVSCVWCVFNASQIASQKKRKLFLSIKQKVVMLLVFNYTAERFNLLLNLVNSYNESLLIDLIWNSEAVELRKKCYQRQSQI